MRVQVPGSPKLFLSCLICLVLSFSSAAVQGLPVVPGIVGFGTETVAGRGGTILVVDSLEDSGAGTLRAAVNATGPRIVIFAISGTINLTSQLTIRNPFITIAGQTAPAPGILIKGETVVVDTHDVLIQHLAFRPGDSCTPAVCEDFDAMTVGAIPGKENYNVVIDHISASWSVDELFTFWGSGDGVVHDVTVRDSIFAEPLNNSGHPKGAHPFGVLAGRNTQRVSILNNVMSIIKDRNPLVRDDTTDVLIANNFVHRPGTQSHGRIYFGSRGAGDVPMRATAANNVAIVRPGSSLKHVFVHTDAPTSFQLYLDNNLLFNPSGGVDGPPLPASGNPWDPTVIELNGRPESSVRVTRAPVCNRGLAPMTEISQRNLEEYLLATAGARPANRDPVDQRIINNIRSRTGSEINSPADVGGYPTLAENRVSHVLPPNWHSDNDNDGYTNIEEWLHAQANLLESEPAPGTVNRSIARFDSFDNGHSSRWTPVSASSWSVTDASGGGSKVFKQSDTVHPGTPARANPAVLSGVHWTNQVVQANLRALSFDGADRWFGIAGRYRDAGNYYYVTLRSGNQIELKKLSGGTSVTLDSAPFTIAANTWYTVRLEMNGSALKAYVNDMQTPLLEAIDSEHASGRAALVMYKTVTEYDNVVTSPAVGDIPLVADDFEDNNSSGWTTELTPWSVTEVECNKVFSQPDAVAVSSRAQIGATQTDMSVQARVRARAFNGANRFLAVYARYRDIQNSYYIALRSNNTIELKKIVGNVVAAPLDQASFNVPLDTWFTVRLEVTGTQLKGYVNGELLLEATDSSITDGRAALGTYLTAAEFDDVLVSRRRP